MRKLLLLLTLPILAPPAILAQEHCMAVTITRRHLVASGGTGDLASALRQVQRGTTRGNGLQTVPVVVHVVWNTAAENVPDASITQMIAQMNQDYQQANADLSTVRPAFTGVIGNGGMEFCLATVDPNGAPTTGITRTQTTETWFDPDTETDDMKSAPKGISPWNPSQYLNIWVCDITSGATGGTVTVGYAYLPVGGVVGSGIDGLVIDYDYGLGAGERTATHEIGHYFGLLHPFDNGNCTDSDGFTDTPTTDSPTFSCSNTGLMKCGTLTQYENFMDYASCSVMFTDQQAAAMQGVLNGARASLLTSPGCGTVPSGPCIPTSGQGTADGDFIDGVQLGSIANLGTGGIGGPAYVDYTGQSTDLERGTAQVLQVTAGTYAGDAFAAWIDYDQDDLFEAGEKLGQVTNSTAGEVLSLPFNVPAGAVLGPARMRVRGVYINSGEPDPADPCFNYNWGQTEDYMVNITDPAAACIPTSTNGTADGDYIDGVQLGTIQNTGTGGTTMPAYSDYTALSTDLVRGDSYTLEVTGGTYVPDHYAAWIDLDQDGQFEAGEKLGELQSISPQQNLPIPFTVPMSADLGSTVMRVRGVFINTGEPTPVDPCHNYAWGETEDYTVIITTSTGVADAAAVGLRIFVHHGQAELINGTGDVRAYRVLDGMGRMVAEGRAAPGRNTLLGAAAAPGVYQVQLLDPSGRPLVLRFLLNGE
ncbi:MAG: hypothetical protein IT228_08445 [Flavobacteriales bacterium]|nr:hypothetical protein [Flavobacteriales bacterium]MCC6577357.1 hypothetical protein [Flavobacteriales bacterium]NUQ16355.1 hypothetical protein [Flavobacteriales bacterium]